MKGLIDRLESIAADNASAGYLKAYRDDLVKHDRRTLAEAKAGDRFIWILRECGTELFPIASGMDAVWATYWLGPGNRTDVPSLTYLVTVGAGGAGTVQSISYDSARELASIPHPEGKVVKISLFARAA